VGATREVVWVPLLVALVLLTALVLPLHVFPVLLAPKWLVYARGAENKWPHVSLSARARMLC